MAESRDEILSVFLRHRAEITRHFSRQTGSHDSAEDLTQEAWIRLMRNREAASVAPGPYLFRTVRNLLIDHFRARRNRLSNAEIDQVMAVADECPGPARHVEDREQLSILMRVVEELPVRQRDILIAARLRREPHVQIAQRYGVTTRTVEFEIRRALDHCARRLSEMNGD